MNVLRAACHALRRNGGKACPGHREQASGNASLNKQVLLCRAKHEALKCTVLR